MARIIAGAGVAALLALAAARTAPAAREIGRAHV